MIWYIARGAGVMALLMLTVSVVLGIATRQGKPLAGLPRFAIATVHRNASLIGLGLVVVHVLSLLFDSYAKLNPVDLVVPFVGSYRQFWLGLGTLAFDLLLLVLITSLNRARLGLRAWRGIHWLSYAIWPIALAHALGTGTDATQLWMGVLAVGCATAVATTVTWRFVT
ncbi:ferric reductase-like transmembrane domain-containing protein [Kutzneria sp. CA-103260]|uniref:ferric reductase-like transmembrane domain-containing protein n=1 Tax=Kutzneria sp. CA-103260 TaxID=2802641 RepID=UPI001BAA4E81|nr:ferric reductase-like transmembrane domain-containing protein [Kutzneria sp. CA-103260]QUQ67828.1 Ferric reductase like transmembrane component [Kutzneria sp. CA-103260]